jgi:hypothetical protein
LKRADGTELFRIKKDRAFKTVLKDAPANAPIVHEVLPHTSAWRSTNFTVHDDEERWPRFPPGTGAFGQWLHEPRFLFERHWKLLEEDDGIGDRSEQDTFQKEVAEAVFQNDGALVQGRGGTGKSHLIELLREKYKSAGFRVDVVAFTHVQAANVDGETVLHDLYKNVRRKRRVLIVDEAGQVPIKLWAVIATLKYIGCRIVALGDFAGQLCPISDQNRIDLWKKLPESDFMHDLCGGLCINLQKFRRGGDYKHFSFVGSIYPQALSAAAGAPVDEERALHGALQDARAKYPVVRASGQITTTLTITNACRVAINARRNAMHAPADAHYEPYTGKDEGAQDMRLWAGIVLQSAVTEKTARYVLENALRYRVRRVTPNYTELVRINDGGEELGALFKLQTADVPQKLRLTYAITYDSSQARTLSGIRLTQTDHPRMTLRRLIVGLGRAPDGADVEVE